MRFVASSRQAASGASRPSVGLPPLDTPSPRIPESAQWTVTTRSIASFHERRPPRARPPPAPVITNPVVALPAAPAVVVPQRFHIEAASHSDVGPKRNHNEDGYALSPDLGLYLVTDGMGGQHSGDRVARMTIAEMLAFFAESHASPAKPSPFAPLPRAEPRREPPRGRIRAANHGIREAVQVRPELVRSGTTIAAVAVTRQYIQLAHVGDCRIYRLRAGTVAQLTPAIRSTADALARSPDLSRKNAPRSRNVILRGIGMADDVLVDTRTEALMTGDVYLLATDRPQLRRWRGGRRRS